MSEIRTAKPLTKLPSDARSESDTRAPRVSSGGRLTDQWAGRLKHPSVGSAPWASTAVGVRLIVHVVTFLIGSANTTPPSDVTERSIQGSISRGQRFEQNIGRGLCIVLEPSEWGWHLDVRPAAHRHANGFGFASIATPPLHGQHSSQCGERERTASDPRFFLRALRQGREHTC